MVKDEAHHAAFAWKVVKWAIEREGGGKVDKQIVELVDRIVSPEELQRMGGGKYKEEDVKLLCDFKTSLLANYLGIQKKKKK